MSNNTAAANRVGWVSEPDGRGTMSLLYSCLFTIFICTWSALHMNTPADTDSRVKVFLRKLKWMAMGILAPELVAWWAVDEWCDAKCVCKELWPSETPKNLTYAFSAIMGGFAIETTDNKRTRLRADHFCHAVAEGIIELPDIETKEVEDKSKADWLSKSIACLQIGWLCAQLIGRTAQHTSVTPLELFTLGIVVCAFVTYGFWWKKPFDLRTPVVIKTELDFRTVQSRLASKFEEWKFEVPLSRISLLDHSKNCFSGKTERILAYAVAIVMPVLFGSCHLAAWTFAFPTSWELLLWRISAVACVVLPLAFFSLNFIDIFTEVYDRTISYIIVVLYVVVRVLLIFGIFFSLRSVPTDVYQSVNWSKYIPHI